MRGSWKYRTLIAIAVAALVAGGATAVARSSGGQDRRPARTRAGLSHLHRGGVLTVAANYLGETRTQLRHELQIHHTLGQVAEATPGRSAAALVSALVSAKATKLKAAVAGGKLSTAEGETAAAALHAHAAAAVERPRALGSTRGQLAIAASYLGVSSAQLRHERKAGHSLAELADARAGKSAAGLIDTIINRRRQLTAGAASSNISPARERMLLSQLRRRVTAAVNRTPAKQPAR